MKSSVLNSFRRAGANQGFALVATLALLVLLMVLTVGMTSLSIVSLRTSGADKVSQRARANARLALQLAIGELQTLAGPDNRVTASSEVGDSGRVQKHLTGVWEGWKWDGQGGAPDWKEEKSNRFKGWLISAASENANRLENFAASAPAGDRVTLVKTPAVDGNVEAGIVSLADSAGKRTGGFAWGAFDESPKASVSLSAQDNNESYERDYDQMTAAHELGFQSVKAADWKVLSTRKSDRAALLTVGQTALLGMDRKEVSFHDATSGSLGLLTNVVEGGFASDLSRLFDEPVLPASFASRFIYSGTDTPLVPAPGRLAGANPLPSPDPSWALLHSHYRTYDRFNGGSPEINATAASVDARPAAGADASHADAFTRQQLAPVIAKAQFVFSLSFGYQGELVDMWADGRARKSPAAVRDNYLTFMVVDPVITLWNPYNVPLRLTDATIELHRVPLAFQIYKNGVKISTSYTNFADSYGIPALGKRAKVPYVLNILPETGQSSLVMQPGEHVVFTAHDWINHAGQINDGKQLTMRPGFNPPAGLASSDEVGGITNQHLFVNAAGQSSGKDYGKTIRTVAVKGGDRIQIDVKAQRAGVDKFEETGGKEVTGFLKYFIGRGTSKKFVGGIELDYGDKESDLLPAFDHNDLPTIVVNPAIPLNETGHEPSVRFKEPFLITTFQQKTERDSRFPSRSWINNAPSNLYASAGLDQTEDFAHQQFEFKWEPMFDWPPDSPTIEISTERNRGYGGSGVYASTGIELASFTSLPIAPAHSLGQFTHAPLNSGGQLPLTSHVVANSFAPPLVPADKVREKAGNRTLLDHSYLANNALFDSYFLSSISDHPAVNGGKARPADTLLRDFFKNGKSLPNSRFKPYFESETADGTIARLKSDKEAYRHIAANLLIEAPFNVNSTSVAAWQAVLASNIGQAAPLAGGGLDQDDRLPVLRNLPSVGSSFESASGDSDRAKWTGYRRLSDDQIETLAKEVVEEVKKRGPFQSLAEFVNRRPGSGELARQGALQAAIERAGLNASVLDSGSTFTATNGPNAAAGSGNTADGAPGVITQADLLTPILPQLTARGDTFVVRAYGEAIGDDGKKVTAWCEATVQRLPGYVDPTDLPTATPLSPANLTFGRRFQVASFRWLAPEEI